MGAPNLEELIRGQWDKEPTSADYHAAAQGAGVEPDQVPICESVAELQLFVFRMRALHGSHEHFRELGDRAAPKPSRMRELKGEGGSTRGPTRGKLSEADRWFANLENPEEDDAELL